MAPLLVEIITYAPTEFYHCAHCEIVWRDAGLGPKIHAEQRAAALPDDLAREYAALGRWAAELLAKHGDRIRLRVVDAASVEGFVKSLRHRLHRYPAFIVGGQKYVGSDLEQATALVEAQLDAARQPEFERR